MPSLPGLTICLFDRGVNNLVAGSVAFVAGSERQSVILYVRSLSKKFSLVIRLVPTVPGPRWIVTVGHPPTHRGVVLTRDALNPAAQIRATAAFVNDRTATLSVARTTTSQALVVVDLDDFCKYVGCCHLGELLDEFRHLATKYQVALLTVAHTAACQIVSDLLTKETASKCNPDDGSSSLEQTFVRAADSGHVASREARSRDPHARAKILAVINQNAERLKPKEITEQLFGSCASSNEHSRVRRLLRDMTAVGTVGSIKGRYFIESFSASSGGA